MPSLVDPPDDQWLIFNELMRMIKKYEKEHPGKTFLRIGTKGERSEYFTLPPEVKWDASWTASSSPTLYNNYTRVQTTVERLVIGHRDKYGMPVYTQWVVVFL